MTRSHGYLQASGRIAVSVHVGPRVRGVTLRSVPGRASGGPKPLARSRGSPAGRSIITFVSRGRPVGQEKRLRRRTGSGGRPRQVVRRAPGSRRDNRPRGPGGRPPPRPALATNEPIDWISRPAAGFGDPGQHRGRQRFETPSRARFFDAGFSPAPPAACATASRLGPGGAPFFHPLGKKFATSRPRERAPRREASRAIRS